MVYLLNQLFAHLLKVKCFSSCISFSLISHSSIEHHPRGLEVVVGEGLIVDDLDLVAVDLREGLGERPVGRGVHPVGDVSPRYRQPLADDLLVPWIDFS